MGLHEGHVRPQDRRVQVLRRLRRQGLRAYRVPLQLQRPWPLHQAGAARLRGLQDLLRALGCPQARRLRPTLVPVALTAPSRSAPLALTSSSARATTSAAIAPAVASAITPPVSASASRATSAPAASPRLSSPKCSTRTHAPALPVQRTMLAHRARSSRGLGIRLGAQ